MVLQVPYEFADPRSGDVASCYADPKLADEELGWKAIRNLDVMCKALKFYLSQTSAFLCHVQ